MKMERVVAVYPTYIVTDGGTRQVLGNKSIAAGQMVHVEGDYIFAGNEPQVCRPPVVIGDFEGVFGLDCFYNNWASWARFDAKKGVRVNDPAEFVPAEYFPQGEKYDSSSVDRIYVYNDKLQYFMGFCTNTGWARVTKIENGTVTTTDIEMGHTAYLEFSDGFIDENGDFRWTILYHKEVAEMHEYKNAELVSVVNFKPYIQSARENYKTYMDQYHSTESPGGIVEAISAQTTTTAWTSSDPVAEVNEEYQYTVELNISTSLPSFDYNGVDLWGKKILLEMWSGRTNFTTLYFGETHPEYNHRHSTNGIVPAEWRYDRMVLIDADGSQGIKYNERWGHVYNEGTRFTTSINRTVTQQLDDTYYISEQRTTVILVFSSVLSDYVGGTPVSFVTTFQDGCKGVFHYEYDYDYNRYEIESADGYFRKDVTHLIDWPAPYYPPFLSEWKDFMFFYSYSDDTFWSINKGTGEEKQIDIQGLYFVNKQIPVAKMAKAKAKKYIVEE